MTAQTMKHALRPHGFLGRWAESQFLAIVTNCASAGLERAAQNVHKMANCSGIQWWDDQLSVSVSVAQAMVQSGDGMETLLQRAFNALGKSLGKSPAVTASSSEGQASAGS